MEYQLALTQKELEIIIQGLGELPLKVSGNVFNTIQQQVTAADSERAESKD